MPRLVMEKPFEIKGIKSTKTEIVYLPDRVKSPKTGHVLNWDEYYCVYKAVSYGERMSAQEYMRLTAAQEKAQAENVPVAEVPADENERDMS